LSAVSATPEEAPVRSVQSEDSGRAAARSWTAAESGAGHDASASAPVSCLISTIRKAVTARVRDADVAEDLVQETLVRVLGAADRVDERAVHSYAVVTARNVVASMWKQKDTHRRNLHRVVDLETPPEPDNRLLDRERHSAVEAALTRLTERERAALLAHEVSGESTRDIARNLGSTPGAVAAQLHRTRARLRVEYLLEVEQATPKTDHCRPVLLAMSAGDRRRQRELDAGGHLLECDMCAQLSQVLLDRSRQRDDETRIRVERDADVVRVRRAAREFAGRVGFSASEQTIIATAVSEATRNIVRFANRGEVVIEALDDPRSGLRISARDRGPGIEDVERAMHEGYSTYGGLGIGLPGIRRLMDEFAIASEVGRGTTITMTKWLEGDSARRQR
jgi:serine/threonine-protein kinase RsbT